MSQLIDFHNLRHIDTSLEDSFEIFCRNLAEKFDEVPADSTFFPNRGAGGDGGVECIWKLSNGDEWGWQMKFVFDFDSNKKAQFDKSVRTALEIHPRLKRYFFCVPFDPPPDTSRPGQSQLARYENWKDEWIHLAQSKNMEVEFILWSKSTLIGKVASHPNSVEFTNFWFGTNQISKQWFSHQVQTAIKSAGPRYTPEHSVDIPIAKKLEAFGRTSKWKLDFSNQIDALHEIGEKISSLRRGNPSLSDPLPEEIDDYVGKIGTQLTCLITEVTLIYSDDMEFVIRDLEEKIGNICALLTKTISDYGRVLSEKFGKEKLESVNFRQSQAEFMIKFPMGNYDLIKEINKQILAFKEWMENELSLANSRELLITGEAGVGKTHFFCDIVKRREKEGLLSILLFGGQFSFGEPWKQICELLGGVPKNQTDLLVNLSLSAEISGKPVIIFIDALNETSPRRTWVLFLARFLLEARAFKNVKICLSCRTPYLETTIPQEVDVQRVIHEGFKEVLYQAVCSFFDFYKLEPPGMPFIQPEFTNPLFLKLACQSLHERGITTFPEEMFSLKELFTRFIESTESHVSLRLGYNKLNKLVERGLKEIVLRMMSNQSRYLPWLEANEIGMELWPIKEKERSLLDTMVSEGILKEDRRYNSSSDLDEDVISFGFELLGDYMIAQSLIEKEGENLQSIFKEGGNLRHLVKDVQSIRENRGLLEALAILLGDLNDVELHDLLDEASPIIHDIILDSIPWRIPQHLGDSLGSLIILLLKSPHHCKKALDILLVLSTRISCPYNSDWLVKYLRSISLGEKDSFWCPYTFFSYENDGTVKNIVDWVFQSSLEHVTPNTCRLWVQMLALLCGSTDKRLRNKSMRAIVKLVELRGDSFDWTRLLDNFSELNDDFIIERLVYAAYGIALRTRSVKHSSSLVKGIWESFIKDNNIPVNALIRDHIRLILELANDLDVIPQDVDPIRFRPPYKSPWPLNVPNDEYVEGNKEKGIYHHLYYQCTFDDMWKYVISPSVEDFEEFDQEAAQRWLFKQVIDMGSSNELHGEFDEYILDTYGEGRERPEWALTIHEKYLYIAYLQLLATLHDNQRKRELAWYEQSPLQAGVRNREIDPTLINLDFSIINDMKSWWSLDTPNFHEELSDEDWIAYMDLPLTNQILRLSHPSTHEDYVPLYLYQAWHQTGQFFDNKRSRDKRRLFYSMETHLIPKNKFESIWKTIENGNLPPYHIPSQFKFGFAPPLIGEYPDSYFPKYCRELEPERGKKTTVENLVVPTIALIGVQTDDSSERSSSFILPGYSFFEFGKLHWDGNAKFEDDKGVAQFILPQLVEGGPNTILIRYEFLNKFLEQNDYIVVWSDFVTIMGTEHQGGLPKGTRLYRYHKLESGKILSTDWFDEKKLSREIEILTKNIEC
nr:hypothetical protein [Candidatus Sigynarchaeum springense]